MKISGESNSHADNLTKIETENVDGLIGQPTYVSHLSPAGASSDEYFHPPIIRERLERAKSTVDTSSQHLSDELDGDRYFEPPIVREADAKPSAIFSSVFSDLQKSGSALLSELIQALSTIG